MFFFFVFFSFFGMSNVCVFRMSNVYVNISHVLSIVSFKNHFKRKTVNKKVSKRKYFGKSANDKLDGCALNILVQGSSSSSALSAARELNNLQEQQGQKKKQQFLPENTKIK